MTNLESTRERYLRDSLPRRLGGLASTLARISSSARHASDAESVAGMMEEGQYFIEWTAAEALTEVAAELVDIQVELAMWRKIWPEAQHHPSHRGLLSFQAKKWSDQVLEFSGLLNTN
ncbi:MAG: hypothetical protein AAB427_06980 [Chloroflexota bacterium]